MHTLLLIPDGVGVRNFVIGDFVPQLLSRGRVTVLHAIPEGMLDSFKTPALEGVRWESLIPYRESPDVFTLRNAVGFAQMFWADTMAMRSNLKKPVRGSWKTKAAYRAARVLGRMSANPAGIQRLNRLYCWRVRQLPETERYREMLRATRPDIVFCSHQRPAIVLPAVLAAQELGIPTATFIFSWDNLTSKGRIAAPFDHYLVWSALMRDELRRYYPEVPPDRIHVVGTPQFDPYTDETLIWPREEFFRRAGADPNRPLICYSGGDTGTCPEDQHHVEVIMQHVRAGRIAGQPQVLVRPAPVDPGKRYQAVREKYPEILFRQPAWVHTGGDWSTVIPTPEDVQFLANLARYADLNVNMASTMTLDFAIHDRPVVNVAFDVADPPVYGVPIWEFFYRFEHYRKVVELGAARFARTAGELAEHINAVLRDPSLERENRRRLVELQGAHAGGASRRICETLATIATRN